MGIWRKMAGGALGAFKSYALWAAVIAVVGLLTTGIIYVHGAEKAKARVPVLEQRLVDQAERQKELIAGFATNKAALLQCLAANESNAIEAAKQKGIVRDSKAEIERLRIELAGKTGGIVTDAETIRGKDKECRTVDEPLPDWFTVGLWQ